MASLGEQKFAVIDRDLIRDCIFVPKYSDMDERKYEEMLKEKSRIDMEKIAELMFSFRNIHRVSNLVGLHSLVKLQLDNNLIERIENLDQLPNLQWLDLSFNRISKIEGLQHLRKLTDLVLYANKIKVIENLDALESLECLSIGRNEITEYQPLCYYLRQFRKLRLLTIEGNPMCADEDSRQFVLALNPRLSFLDYKLVQESELKEAQDRFRNELLKINQEDLQEEERRKDMDSLKKDEEKFSMANMSGIPSLFGTLFSVPPEIALFEELHPLFISLIDDYKVTFEVVKKELSDEMFRLYNERHFEKLDFDAVINSANTDFNQKAKMIVDNFEMEMNQLLLYLRASEERGEEIDLQEEHDSLILLKQKNEEKAEELLEMEVTRVEQFSEVYEDYKGNIRELQKHCKAAISHHLAHAIEDNKEFQDKLKNRIQEVSHLATTPEGEKELIDRGVSARGLSFLRDSEAVSSMMTKLADYQYKIIDHKLKELTKKEDADLDELVRHLDESDHKQNRSRVTEIWMWVERNNQEIEVVLEPIREELAEEENRDPYRR